MKFTINGDSEYLFYFYFEDDENKNKLLSGELGSILPASSNKLFVGLGKKDDFDNQKLQEAAMNIGKFSNAKKISNIGIELCEEKELDTCENIFLIIEGIYNSAYNFDKYKNTKFENYLSSVNIASKIENTREIETKIKEFTDVLDAVFFARDLVNTRANDMYPEVLAKCAFDALTPYGANVKIYDEKDIKKLGLDAFYAVSKGSEKNPRFIVIEYLNGNKNDRPIALVGKGLTYDSGGYSIKSTKGMTTMYSDMAGAATVIGAIRAVASQKLKKNVVGIIAACENMISGNSYKPGDIINSLSGKKIEIDNSDAEGRVTLADAVYYAADVYNPKCIIDLATLTGACLIALGEEYTGAVTNDDALYERLKHSAEISNEKMWKLPNDKKFKELIKSDTADILNSGSNLAGTITAGQFIEHFVKETPWVHLDIAGTAFLSKENGILPKGATGVHVKTLYNFIKNEGEKNE